VIIDFCAAKSFSTGELNFLWNHCGGFLDRVLCDLTTLASDLSQCDSYKLSLKYSYFLYVIMWNEQLRMAPLDEPDADDHHKKITEDERQPFQCNYWANSSLYWFIYCENFSAKPRFAKSWARKLRSFREEM